MKVRIGYGLGTWLSERVTGDCPDPIVGLGVAAGLTTRIKLGFSVLVVPGRNPMLLAKELATLDRLSHGRLLPAFGLGAVDPAEHQAFGVARGDRAEIFDEVLPLLRRLWAGETLDHGGVFHHYEGAVVRPLPLQDPLEIWLGGIAPSELKRCGRLGDGWLPSFCTPEDVQEGIVVIEATAAEHDRAIDPGRVIASGLDGLQTMIRDHIDVGGSKFVVIPLAEPDDWDTHLAEVADALLPLQS